MKISPPAGHDIWATRPPQQSGTASSSASFARMLVDRPSPERAAERAFGFGEFGILGLHPLRDRLTAPAAAPHHAKNGTAEPPARMAGAEPAAAGSATPVTGHVAGPARSTPLTGPTAAPRSGSEQGHQTPVAASPVDPGRIAAFSDETAQPPVEKAGGGPDLRRHGRTTPWFSISLDETTKHLQLAAALHDLDEPDRERLLRRLSDVAAEFGVELAEFRLDGQPMSLHRIKQRS